MNSKWADTKKFSDIPLKERDEFIKEEIIQLFHETCGKVSTLELATHVHKKYHWDSKPFVESTKRVMDMRMEGKVLLLKYRARG